ncbi:hypothetical protein TNCV_4164161, partial [Trichonephila clavipes]
MSHAAPAPIDLLRYTFGDRLISRFRPVNWPPRSCDLTPLDYFCSEPSAKSILAHATSHKRSNHIWKTTFAETLCILVSDCKKISTFPSPMISTGDDIEIGIQVVFYHGGRYLATHQNFLCPPPPHC